MTDGEFAYSRLRVARGLQNASSASVGGSSNVQYEALCFMYTAVHITTSGNGGFDHSVRNRVSTQHEDVRTLVLQVLFYRVSTRASPVCRQGYEGENDFHAMSANSIYNPASMSIDSNRNVVIRRQMIGIWSRRLVSCGGRTSASVCFVWVVRCMRSGMVA